LQEFLDFEFSNIQLLIQALIHKSFFHENKLLISSDNEKLEFLGDSIINLIVTKFIFVNYPLLTEGEMSKLRGTLVNEASFAKLAQAIKMSENIFIGKGEFRSNGFLKDSILADSFEALFGAIFLTSNLETTEKIFFKVIHQFESESDEKYININSFSDNDPKSKLQELSMEKLAKAPVYQFKNIDQGFEVELWIDDKCLGTKQGISKKKLEKELAKYVIDNNLI
jgi:ribonuclease-3